MSDPENIKRHVPFFGLNYCWWCCWAWLISHCLWLKKWTQTSTTEFCVFQQNRFVFNKTIAGRRRTLLLNVKPARMSVGTQTWKHILVVEITTVIRLIKSKIRSCKDHSDQTPFFFSIRQMWANSWIRRKKHSAAPPGIEPGSSDCRSDALTTELRSHDRNCVWIFFFFLSFTKTVSSFSLRGDPHARAYKYKHGETNENSQYLIITVQIENVNWQLDQTKKKKQRSPAGDRTWVFRLPVSG